MCCRLPLKILVGSSAPFYWKFIYISSKAELSIINIFSFIGWKWKYFLESNWDVGPVLSQHCCIVYSDGLPQTMSILSWPRAHQGWISGKTKYVIFFFFFSWQKFHCSRPQKMCALWSKTNYGFYLLTFNHYLFRASEGKWEIGFVGICSSCSN